MSYTFGSYPGGVWEGPGGHTICANRWCKSLFACHTNKRILFYFLKKRSIVLQRAVTMDVSTVPGDCIPFGATLQVTRSRASVFGTQGSDETRLRNANRTRPIENRAVFEFDA